MEIRRLLTGDEQLVTDTVLSLIPTDEREGEMPSVSHVRELLSQDENYMIVALNASSPIGFLVAYRMPLSTRDASMVYLYQIDVAPAHRRQGVATGMIELLKALCRQAEVAEIWVGTEYDNAPARQLYESTGAICGLGHSTEYVYRL